MKQWIKNIYNKLLNNIFPIYKKVYLLERKYEELFSLLDNYSYLKHILLNNSVFVNNNTLTSQICNLEFWNYPFFRKWALILKENPLHLHRKLWEYIYITQVLYENNLLSEGKKGLGFAVGTEPLPALFASLGCEILATDINGNTKLGKGWIISNQNANGEINKLNNRGICDEETFKKNVKYRNVDMNNIPKDLKEFDFCWSACAVEHIGGLDKSLEHICNCMEILKPGGIFVFTTEYNLSSEDETLENPYNYIFTKKNIEMIKNRLEKAGHYVYPLDLKLGESGVDKYVDMPPYHQKLHLRSLFEGYVVTSIGIIVRNK